jgi:hypothetical protein
MENVTTLPIPFDSHFRKHAKTRFTAAGPAAQKEIEQELMDKAYKITAHHAFDV